MKQPLARAALTDRFGRRHTYLRLSLVERCNLRCRYCMPAEGLDWTPDAALLSDEELVRLTRLFVAQGVRRVRLTGGEPLLRAGIECLVAELAALDGLESLAMTTNGLLLPRKINQLWAAGLAQLNVSLDTLRPERFEAITRRRGLELVLRGVDMALERGYEPRINCVVMRGVNDDELADLVALTERRALEVRFIEFMPFDGNRWRTQRFVPYAEMLARLGEVFALERLADAPHATSKRWRARGFTGSVGFITSMSEHFCDDCNRLRVTADGNLKVCLFGRAEVSLRDAMRAGASDAALGELIAAAVDAKHARHAGMLALAERENRPMITIGG